jgi:hypothetical protein
MMSREDARHDAGFLSETEVSERMTSFRAALARMNADPGEAARILALAEKTDYEISETLVTDALHEYDPENSLRTQMMTAAADKNPSAAGLEVFTGEAGLRAQRRLLEAERTAHRAELDLAMASQRSDIIISDAQHQAELVRQEAAFSAQQRDLDALREKLRSAQLELDTAREKERKPSHAASRKGWLSRISLNPALTILQTAVIGAVVAMQYHALVIAATFTATAAFNAVTYAAAILLSVRDLNRSGPGGAESALRLLLGTRPQVEAAHALPAAPKSPEHDKPMTRQDRVAHSPHGQPLNGENCTVVFSEIAGFGDRIRTDQDRLIIRTALFSMIHSALQGMPDVWSEDRGDGILTVIPPGVPTAEAMDQLIHVLPRELDRHNSGHHDSARFRLRVAVHVGPVFSDDRGVSGETIIIAARLLDAPAFKAALTSSNADLGVIASAFIYETVIRHGRDSGYSQVRVEVKETRTTAWMKLLPAGQLQGGEGEDPPRPWALSRDLGDFSGGRG